MRRLNKEDVDQRKSFKAAQKACVGGLPEMKKMKKYRSEQQIVQEKVVFKKPQVSDIYDWIS